MINDIVKKTAFWIVAVLIAAIPVIIPLTKEGYFSSHDGEWAVIRLAEMHREIKDGQLPPRWSGFLNHGYGYPLFLFTYPFPYYVGEVIHLSGFGLIDSIKIVFLISVVGSGVAMYFLGKKLNGDVAGFIAAVLYMYAPFRLVDLYVRGSIGESLSFMLFPLLFLTTVNLVTNPTSLRVMITALVFAALVMTHNVMAILFTPFWIIFMYVVVKMYAENTKTYILKYFIPVILLGLGLSSFFWIPALFEKQYIILSQVSLTDKSQHFIQPLEFIYSSWNYGIRPSFQLGWIHIALFAAEIVLLLLLRGIQSTKLMYIGLFAVGATLICLILTNEISSLLWKAPLVSSIDFPWRVMTLLAFFMSLGAIYLAEKKKIKIISIVLLVCAFFLIQNFAKPERYIQTNDEYYQTNDATTTSMDELMPIWVKEKATNKPTEKAEILVGEAQITGTVYDSDSISISGNASTQSKIGINTIYFPGWTIKVNKEEVIPDYSNAKGIMTFDVPPGSFEIVGLFSRTPIRLYADIISLLSLFVCIGIVGWMVIKWRR